MTPLTTASAMEINKDIRELSAEDQMTVTGGGYVEAGLGLVSGLAFAAGFAVAPPLLGAAVVAGAAFLYWDSF